MGVIVALEKFVKNKGPEIFTRIALGLGVFSSLVAGLGLTLDILRRVDEFDLPSEPFGVPVAAALAIVTLTLSVPYHGRPRFAGVFLLVAMAIILDASVYGLFALPKSLLGVVLSLTGVPVVDGIGVPATAVLSLLLLMRLSAPLATSLRGIIVIAASMLVIVLLGFRLLGIEAFGAGISAMTSIALGALWGSLTLLLAGPALGRWFRPRDLASRLGQLGLVLSAGVPLGFASVVPRDPADGSVGVLETFLIMALAMILTNLTLFIMFMYREAASQSTRLRVAQHMAHHDLLTGAKSRLAVSHFVRSGRPLAGGGRRAVLVIVDIDKFKVFNDHYGHPVGDEVLNRVARMICKGFGPESFIARWGGDEFLVLADERDEAALAELHCTINDRLGQMRLGSEICLSVSTSAGAVRLGWPTSSEAFDAAVKVADDAMYAAKQAGGCRIVVSGQTVPAGAVASVENERPSRDWFEHTVARQLLGSWFPEREPVAFGREKSVKTLKRSSAVHR